MSREIEKWGDGYLVNGKQTGTFQGALLIAKARAEKRAKEEAEISASDRS